MAAAEEKTFPVDDITGFKEVDILAMKSVGLLAAETVEKAKSGHPGAPMGMAGAAHLLWSKYMNGNPANAKWLNRDRFVLSNGHACALQYTMLHLTGYDLSMDDLKNFRQLESRTPGHPETHAGTPGVEVSTGPLGQGIAQGVGLAIAQKHLAGKFNEEGFDIFDSNVYVFCGDGCLQQGVSSEASSLAGHLKLSNLIVIYDDNNITIDGKTSLSFSEAVVRRYRAYGWQTYIVEKGNTDFEMLGRAIEAAQKSAQPTLIALRTVIGWGSTKADTHGVHGSPLGAASMKAYKSWLGFDTEKSFAVDDAVYDLYKSTFAARGAKAEEAWNASLASYAEKFPTKFALLERMRKGELPSEWRELLPKFDGASAANATRSINGDVLNALAAGLDEIIGGSADLTPSTMTDLKCSHDFQAATPDGRYLRFGVREFGMFAICNGISAFDGLLYPFSATFLNFITYGWGAARLGALSCLRHVYIMTHDSVWLGEDGPTHQPIETIPLMRATPNMYVWRPSDGREVNASWIFALETAKKAPTVMCLSRHKFGPVDGVDQEKALCGAYAVSTGDASEEKAEDLVLIATGSELHIAAAAAEKLRADGVSVRVVSAPCLGVFDEQPLEYRLSVLPANVPVLSIEAASTFGWSRYAHASVGIDRFGASAPLSALEEYFGFRPEDVVTKSQKFLAQSKIRFGSKAPLLDVQVDAAF